MVKNMLQKKIFRDILTNWRSFAAIIIICTLGIILFCGMNLYVSTMERITGEYYESQELADYWVYGDINETDQKSIASLPWVKQTQRRKTIKVGAALEGNPVIVLHASEGSTKVNMPVLLSGENLIDDETDTCLLDSQFAKAHNLSEGDKIKFMTNGKLMEFNIKGIVMSPEYVYSAPEGALLPDYHSYGFAYTTAAALPDISYNELTVTAINPMNDKERMQDIKDVITEKSISVISRKEQPSIAMIHSDVQSMKSLSVVFPVIFFTIAALVTWITLGRMMDNQRQQLGILRSIGYSKMRIMAGYSAFGIMITIPSSVLGILGARYLIAGPLYTASIKYYTIAENSPRLFTPSFWIAVLIVGIVTCGAAFLSATKSLALMPASLLRPKQPAKGKRILLERVAFLWKHMNFSGKMISRNLFRSKARLVMGLLGVVGSTALILGGLGVRDSMNHMIDMHYNKTLRYDMKITLSEKVTTEDVDNIAAMLDAEIIERSMALGVYTLQGSDRKLQPLIVLEEENRSIGLYDQDNNVITLPSKGVVITQMLSKQLKVGIGDILTVELMDGKKSELLVSNIAVMQMGQGIYMSKTVFDEMSLAEYRTSELLIQGSNSTEEALRNNDLVKSIETKENQKEALDETMELMKSVQYMTIVFAAVLSFAVMYVIGQLNFHERIRELATLKVLGFYHGEMKKLVLSENMIIAIVGAPLGVLAGFGLLQGILSEATTSDMAITLHVEPFTIVTGVLLTLLFIWLVNTVIGRKFKKVDMVESLKSVE